MANAIASQVQALYVGYLGRAADQAGLDFWTNAIANGTSTLESVALGFTLSTEYQSLYADKTSEELAAAIYQNVLGRAADADGLAFWVGEIENGTVTADTLLAAMLNSLGTVDQQTIDNKVYVANAYTAAAGSDYDADAGAAILVGVDSTAKSVSDALLDLPVSTETFNAALNSLLNANDAVTANLEAWGEANDVDNAGASDVYSALATAEAAVETAAADADLGISAATQAALDDTTEAATSTGYNAADAAEALALSVARSEIATKKIALDGALTAAVAGLEAVSPTDKAGSLKVLVDSYLAKAEAVIAAQTAQAATDLVLDGKVAEANVLLETAFDVAGASAKDYSFTVATTAANVVQFDGSVGTDDFGNYQATYDAAADKWAYAKNDGTSYVSMADAAVAADANLQKLLANATVKGVIEATVANAEATAGVTAAQTAVTTELNKIAAVDSSLVSSGALAAAADTYADAVKALADHAEAKAAFEEAVAGVDAARGDAAELAALQNAAVKAEAALLAAGWNAHELDGAAADATDTAGASSADVANDVFLFAGEDSSGSIIANFGLAGTDLIKFAAGEYTLVNVSAADFGNKALGSASALEIFVVDGGANTTVYVEQNAFDGSTTSAQANLVDITLTGVTGDTASLSDTGYLSFA